MQTFLPYPNFHDSARVLDWRRLGKQRVETWQIATMLLGDSAGRGRLNHPAVKMWRGHVPALCLYGVAVCIAWRERGYRDTMLERFTDMLRHTADHSIALPEWHGDATLHAAYRAALLTKNPTWYAQFGWTETPKIAYVWPK
jgi:hypothetical protein